MATSDADKPPVYSPAPGAAEPLAPGATEPTAPSEGAEQDEAIVDAVLAPVVPRQFPGMLFHWTFLAVGLAVVGASVSLGIRDREKVIVPIINAPLPGTCTFRGITGVPCPGCGLTRSFISMGHGRFVEAWNYNPAGFLFFAVVAFQIPYRIYQIHRIRRGRAPYRFAWVDNCALIALVVALLVQWAYAVAVGTT